MSEPDVSAVLLFPSWRELARRGPPLLVGIALVSLGISLSVRAHLGISPWDVFHQGVSKHTGLSLGWVIVGVGVIVLLVWMPLHQKLGVGTVINTVAIGVLVKVFLPLIGAPHAMSARIAMFVAALAALGLGGGLYIGAALGPGPRDGLMTAITARGHRLWVVRTVMELSVLVVGWILGGNVGAGTAIIAFTIGPITHFTIRRFHLPVPPSSVEVLGE